MKYPIYVKEVIERLEEDGYEAYIVGGSVRDLLLGKTPNDYDVTTSALPEQTLEVFSDMRTIPTGIKHGTVTVISHGEPIEVTTFRVDGEYLDCRRPESVSFTDKISADLSRRDFTVNAMAYSEKRGVIDLFGGAQDLKKGIIRAVGDPILRFSEDALRIMRAFRFSAQLGFEIEDKTLKAAATMKEGLSKISAERIASEFVSTICNNTANTVLQVMESTGVLELVTRGYLPSETTREALVRTSPSPHIRLGVFLSELDEEKGRAILNALKLSNKLSSHSMHIASSCKSKLHGSPSDARRFIGKNGALTLDVLDAARALGNLDDNFEREVRLALEAKACATSSELALNGGDLVKLGAKGKQVGRLLELLLEAVIEDPTLNEKEKLLTLAIRELKKD